MAYVRFDENAIDHPKFVAISANAFRLWIEGTSYCQKHLTDGAIPALALKRFRYYSPSSVRLLLAVLVSGKGPLWHETPDGVTVHDYLEHNDPRETVEKNRKEAKDRYRRWKDKRSNGVGNGVVDPRANGTTVPSLPVPSQPKNTRELTRTRDADDTQTLRVQRFVDRYRELHEEYIGVAYLGNPHKDYQAACELVAAFDDPMLEAISVFGLNDTSEFMADGTRTLTKLKSRASDYAQHLKAKKLA